MKTWAYIFISSRQPKKGLRSLRAIHGVIHADALFGSPDLIAIVSGDDIASMDAVIDEIAAIPDVTGTDSKIARWIDGVEFPLFAQPRSRPKKGGGKARRTEHRSRR
jgi:DNA-binding Lrp family transcriptional regulator